MVLLAGCSLTPTSNPAPSEPSSTPDASANALSPQGSPIAGIGDFPTFPQEQLPEPAVESLQAALDGAVEDGAFPGVSAAIIVGGSGSWSGASGIDPEGKRLTPESRLLTASVAKTVTAAEVLSLVEEGTIELSDPITDHLPPKAVAAFDANGATIRDVLGMRSGILDPPGYIQLVDSGAPTIEVLEAMVSPFAPAGSETSYANINFVLLGMVIEHVTGRSLWENLRSDVLRDSALDGLVYPVSDALAADGWRVESDAATLARWGYELYGGFVLSDESLREMTDFRGELYGLGTVDLTSEDRGDFDVAAVGHGGIESPYLALLAAFPETEVVVGIQVTGGVPEQVYQLVRALTDAVT